MTPSFLRVAVACVVTLCGIGPMQLERMAIYTDISSQRWRVKRHGERQDKAFSFKSDAAENWNRLRVYVMGG